MYHEHPFEALQCTGEANGGTHEAAQRSLPYLGWIWVNRVDIVRIPAPGLPPPRTLLRLAPNGFTVMQHHWDVLKSKTVALLDSYDFETEIVPLRILTAPHS